MQKSIAAVFDSAGTLLHMYRVAKDINSGKTITGVESTALVAQRKGRALIVLHTEPAVILSVDRNMRVIDFIEDHGVAIDISCASIPFSLDEAYDIIKDSNIKIGDILQVVDAVKVHCPKIFYVAAGIIVDRNDHTVPYVLSTGGRMFHDTKGTIDQLKARGVDVYIASGDSRRNLKQLAGCIDIPMERVYDIATTREKARIVLDLKEKYDRVLMVGDGMNDILALRAADIGVVTLQQGDERPEKLERSADVVIRDIREVLDIVDSL
ncbi:HAD family hydrolase [Methanococcoides orientis]|uniref:HAD family hydrolase n=1 Tax=Methanococcoides orientis TaxID=2822137 RepID=UPI001E33269F|nr:HAD family hydrolase [Methanococcoides orientis]UGV40523.1 HAD family hydrolase [Methanococcoides orientis]